MPETKQIDHHLVEIATVQHNPLTEISQSPGHLLLLKLLQREQHLSGRRIAGKERTLDNLRREIFQLCLYFFAFHGLFLTFLFNSSGNVVSNCRKWWIPFLTSLSFCLVMMFLVQMKLLRYWNVFGQILNEKTCNRDLIRLVQELRVKGVRFDLSKDPGNGKRVKSSRVGIQWKPFDWCGRYFVTICLVAGSGLVLFLCKLILCV